MNEALELMRIVESRGGRFILDGAQVFIEPEEAALPIVESLRAHKMEIRSLLQSKTEPQADAEHDSDALLSEWMLERCACRDRSWTTIAALHLDCSKWCADHERTMPTSRRAFERALQAEGFTVTDGWCYGLLSKPDVLGMEPRNTTAKRMRAQRGSATAGSGVGDASGDSLTHRGAGNDFSMTPLPPTALRRPQTHPQTYP